MKIVLTVVVSLIFLYIVGQALYTGYYLRRSKILVKTTYTGQSTLGSGPTFNLFAAGDSLGAGIGASSFETSLVGRVASNQAQDHAVKLQNQSLSGARMDYLLALPPPAEHQNLILLVISSNDLLHSTSLGTFSAETNQALSKFAPLTDRLIIIGPGNVGSGGLIPLVVKPYFNLRRHKYVEALQQAAAKFPNATYINPVDQPTSFVSRYNKHTTSTDLFHLNDEGYRWWADLVIAALNSH